MLSLIQVTIFAPIRTHFASSAFGRAIKATQNHILENLTERFDVVGSGLTDKIKSIQSLEILNALFRKTNRVNTLEEFKELVDKALES